MLKELLRSYTRK